MGFVLFSLDHLAGDLKTLIEDANTGGSLVKNRIGDSLENIDAHLTLLKNEALADFDATELQACEKALALIKKDFNRLTENQLREKINSLPPIFDRLIGQLAFFANMEDWLSGKYNDKNLNFLMNVITQFSGDPKKKNEIKAAARDYFTYFSELSRYVRRLIKSISDFPQFSSELKELYDLHEQAKPALQKLAAKLEKGDFNELDVDSLDRYAAHYQALSLQIASIQLEESASSALSIDIKEGDLPASVMTTHLKTLLNAIEDFQDEEINQKEFEGVLSFMEEKTAAGLRQFEADKKSRAKTGSATKAELEEIDEAFHDGILRLQEGLKGLRHWLVSRSREELLSAIRACREGTARIYQSQLKAESLAEPPPPSDLA